MPMTPMAVMDQLWPKINCTLGDTPQAMEADSQPFEIHYIPGLKKLKPIGSISLPGNRCIIITYIKSFSFSHSLTVSEM